MNQNFTIRHAVRNTSILSVLSGSAAPSMPSIALPDSRAGSDNYLMCLWSAVSRFTITVIWLLTLFSASLLVTPTVSADTCSCPRGSTEYKSSASLSGGNRRNICVNGSGGNVTINNGVNILNATVINGGSLTLNGSDIYNDTNVDVACGGSLNTGNISVNDFTVEADDANISLNPTLVNSWDVIATNNTTVTASPETINCFAGFVDDSSALELTADTLYMNVYKLLNSGGVVDWSVENWSTNYLSVVNAGKATFTATQQNGSLHEFYTAGTGGALRFGNMGVGFAKISPNWDYSGSGSAARAVIDYSIKSNMTAESLGIRSGCAGGNFRPYVARATDICGDGIDNDYNGVVDDCPPSMTANNNSFNGQVAGSRTPSVLINDVADGEPATDALVTTPTVLNDGGLTGVSINADGTINIPVGASSSNYSVVYQVCLQAYSAACDSAIAFVEIPTESCVANVPVPSSYRALTSGTYNPDGDENLFVPEGVTVKLAGTDASDIKLINKGTVIYAGGYKQSSKSVIENCGSLTFNSPQFLDLILNNHLDGNIDGTGLNGRSNVKINNEGNIDFGHLQALSADIVNDGNFAVGAITLVNNLDVRTNATWNSGPIDVSDICFDNFGTANIDDLTLSSDGKYRNVGTFTLNTGVEYTGSDASWVNAGTMELNFNGYKLSSRGKFVTFDGAKTIYNNSGSADWRSHKATSNTTLNGNFPADEPFEIDNGMKGQAYSLCTGGGSIDSSYISASFIAANDDNFTGQSAGVASPSVLTNDDANGEAATDALATTPTVQNDGGLVGVSINSDGTINIPSSTPAGNYTLVYQVCLQADAAVCDTATVLIEVYAPPEVGGGSCSASGHTDVLFIVDNSGSITTDEYADFSASIQRVGNQVLSDNSNNRIAVAHFGGPGGDLAYFGVPGGNLAQSGQYIYIERDFSNAVVQPPVRQFGHGGAYNANWNQDHLAAAIGRLQYAIDGDPGTSASPQYILSPVKEMARDASVPLQIVIMTDADRYYTSIFGNDISILIDPAGSAAEPNDGSDFTIYNQLKQDGVSFSVVSFSEYANAQEASAAIASVGGLYNGNIDINLLDPEGSQQLPRKFLKVESGFVLTPEQISSVAYNIAEFCGGQISGTIFEDLNYGGGSGRAFGTAGTVGLPGVSIEVYDEDNLLVRTVQSEAGGAYNLPGLPNGNYFLRVVNDTVDSSRAGGNGSEVPVMTYRSDGTNIVTNEVGGRYPDRVDAPANNDDSSLDTSTFIFSSGSLTGQPAQSVQPVTISNGDVSNADFGFNFNTVVNTNASGQGTLQQFVQNNSRLSGAGIAQQLPASVAGDYAEGDIVVAFMIPADQLNGSNEAVIKPAAAISVSQSGIVIDGRLQSANTGSGSIVLDGQSAGFSSGIEFYNADGSVLRDITVTNFSGSGVVVHNSGAASRGVRVAQNTITTNGQYGVLLENDTVDSAIIANTIHGNSWAGIANDASPDNTLSQNSLANNGGLGIDLGVDGVTANSNFDGWLNYPEVGSDSSVSSNGTAMVAYDFGLEVPVNTYGYRVEFFSNADVDSSGHGEGLNYLGYVDITPSAGGLENFKGSFNANAAVPENANIALTLIEKTGSDALGKTSEFSKIHNGNVSVCTDVLSNPGASLGNVRVDENSPVLIYLEARDAAGNPITYIISGGADSSQFTITQPEPGALIDCAIVEFMQDDTIFSARGMSAASVMQARALTSPGDYEFPTDDDGDNTYQLSITAIDYNGNQVVKPLNVVIQDVNEKPFITTSSVSSFIERQQGVIVDLEAYDPDADDAEGSGLSYRLNGGADVEYFEVDAETGELRFRNAPDFDYPLDQNADNRYELSVKVSDDEGYTSSKNLVVEVTDDPANNGVKLRVRALLQGAYESKTGMMHDSLRSKGVLPVAQPYQAQPFNHAGSEQINLDLVTVAGNDAIVDWLLLELRSATDSTQVINSLAALVQRDGDIVDAATGLPDLNFLAAAGEYYISLRHRNHLGVMTSIPVFVGVTGAPVVIDFTQASTGVSGGENARMVTAANDDDIALMWSGDTNQDQRLIALGQGSDINLILGDVLSAPENTAYNSSYQVEGYNNTDLNMDGVALFMGPANDSNVLLGNVFLHPANSSFFGNYVIAGGLTQ